MPKRRREIRGKPDHYSRQGRFLMEALPDGVRIPHKHGEDHVVTLREILTASAEAAGCTPRELVDWLGEQFNTTSGPSGPDHSTESGHVRRDLA